MIQDISILILYDIYILLKDDELNIIFTLYFLYCIFPHAAYITGFICNRRANIVFKFFLAVVRKECACMSSYLALQIPHQKVILFKTSFQPERGVHTPVNRNFLFTKIC